MQRTKVSQKASQETMIPPKSSPDDDDTPKTSPGEDDVDRMFDSMVKHVKATVNKSSRNKKNKKGIRRHKHKGKHETKRGLGLRPRQSNQLRAQT